MIVLKWIAIPLGLMLCGGIGWLIKNSLRLARMKTMGVTAEAVVDSIERDDPDEAILNVTVRINDTEKKSRLVFRQTKGNPEEWLNKAIPIYYNEKDDICYNYVEAKAKLIYASWMAGFGAIGLTLVFLVLYFIYD